jgi:hypothetical protein
LGTCGFKRPLGGEAAIYECLLLLLLSFSQLLDAFLSGQEDPSIFEDYLLDGAPSAKEFGVPLDREAALEL